jgi:uncharacterized heparinase superfamily protein
VSREPQVPGAPPDYDAWRELVGRTGDAPAHTPVYRMRLAGVSPASFRALPFDRRPVDPRRGQAIFEGRWRFGAAQVDAPVGHAPWGPPFPSSHFADRIHRFHWLRDVASLGLQGETQARGLVSSWIDEFGKWDAFAWRPSPTADRIINLVSAGPWLVEGLEPSQRDEFFDSFCRQVRHLLSSGGEEADPVSRFRIAVALSLAGAAIEGGDRFIDAGLPQLEAEANAQILADGGHITRSPQALANALIDIHAVEDLLLRTGRQAPAFLNRLQARMAVMLSFFTLPGGHLLVANGGGDGEGGLAGAALQPHGTAQARFAFARLSGFHRVLAGDLSMFMDTGPGPDRPYGARAHAGALGLWINDGPSPLIVSCGANPDLEPVLREASRRTAAHSVLSLSGEDAAIFMPDDLTGLRQPVGPVAVSAHRLEEADQFLLEGQHGAWRVRYGLIFRRRLYIAREGNRITGEDALSRPVSESLPAPDTPVPFVLRFHLHPDVDVHQEDDRMVYLGVESREIVWRFRSELPVRIEDSRYWGGGGSRKTVQLVIEGSADPRADGSAPPNRIRWALSKLASEAWDTPPPAY